MYKVKFTVALLLLYLSLGLSATTFAQGTAFTYQGKLTDNGNLANGNYDFQFKLFDTQTVGTGTQIGALVAVPNVPVTNGTFTAQLDFGVCPSCFDGSARFLEIAVRPTSGSTFTTLGPRQPLTSTPYALKSQNAAAADGLSVACVNCVTSSHIQSVNGSAVTGTIPVSSVPAGSTNYIQNGTSQQASSNFNISGSGTAGGTLSANILNATTQFNLGNARVLSAAGSLNLFAGISAGMNNTGNQNAFFGSLAGQANQSGSFNAFFGFQAGFSNTTGGNNTFIGRTADFNSSNPTGDNNTLLGALSSVTSGSSNATAIGFKAQVAASNALVLGGITGVNGGTSVNVGVGTTAPTERLHVVGNGLFTGNLTVNGTLTANLPAGSASYIQNGTSQQAASNFNISGTGTATILNATMHYSIAGLRVFTANGPFNDGTTIFTASNTFAGDGAGLNTTPDPIINFANGKFNAFFGAGAGQANTVGNFNAFFGYRAGQQNTGSLNAFFGSLAGSTNTTGSQNAFFGFNAGNANTTGIQNAFFGLSAGASNTTGGDNAFFGEGAGDFNTTGNQNAFFGKVAGSTNSTGLRNTFIGAFANFNASNTTGNDNTLLGAFTTVNSGVTNGTAIGALASVTQSNSLVLGSILGVNGCNAGCDTVKVGIGTPAPAALLDVQRDNGAFPETVRITTFGTDNIVLGRAIGGTRSAPIATPSGRDLLQLGGTGYDGTAFVSSPKATIVLEAAENWTSAAQGTNIRFNTTLNGTTTTTTKMIILNDGSVGIGTTAPADKLDVNGDIRVGTGLTGCVKDSDGTVIAGTACSSDARFKRAITPFPHLLDKLVQLQPVQFYWRADEFKERHFGIKPSFGLIAQDVEKVLPELVTEDEQGYKAVNYSKLPLLSLQAIKELKAENDTLKQRLTEQQNEIVTLQNKVAQIEALKRAVCQAMPAAEICKP